MLRADGLDQGFFMILDGGNVPDPWSQQYTCGSDGRIACGGRPHLPGEEFRGKLQGHNNLHGIARVLEPISVGGMGTPPVPENWPSTHDVLKEIASPVASAAPLTAAPSAKPPPPSATPSSARANFSNSPTPTSTNSIPGSASSIAVTFFPRSPTPTSPTFPGESPPNPSSGETRSYGRIDDPATADFEDWKKSLRADRSFITSGPLIPR